MIATPPPTSLEASRKAPLPTRIRFREFLTIEEGDPCLTFSFGNSRHREQSRTRLGLNTDLFHWVRDHNTGGCRSWLGRSTPQGALISAIARCRLLRDTATPASGHTSQP